MNIPSFLTMSKRIYLCALVVMTMAFAVSAQKYQDGPAPESPPNLDQCQNGKFGTPQADFTTECEWVNGNLNSNNSHWVEGDFVPYRIVITDSTTSITIGYDTTENGKHTIDYLGDYDASLSKTLGIEPCDGFTACVAGTPGTMVQDPLVFAAIGSYPIGEFSIWNGDITSVVFNGYTGDFSGTSQASYTITFTHDNATDPVIIAWSGHISTRDDWTAELSAIAIKGSSYHMRNLTTGNQDRSLKVEGQTFPAKLTIIKEIANLSGVSDIIFGFDRSDTGVAGTADFFLQDNGDDTDGFSDRITIDYPLADNATTSVNITELIAAVGNGWSVSDIECVDASGGVSFQSNSTPQPGQWALNPTNTATANLQTSELVTCTFSNTQSFGTAAPASIGGRVTASNGRGLAGVSVILTDLATSETVVVKTNTFGYYRFDSVDTNAYYSLTVASKRYSFPNPTVYFTLEGDMLDMNFVAE
jgi:hypothetical protein